MTKPHHPAELPPDTTDEERVELERGRRLLRAMVDLVRQACADARGPSQGGDGRHE
ncbi:hypothetical protein [Shinella pollutisoli]|uniref:Uncharacterized protein n=1 Tax=Shinella pollutisoli TaxID=2250594 RepID=A0ABV7DGL0_9HYPH|nr:hypothetical protein [Shinella pollutisoli]